jgi:carboxymethylenebutenolidase
MTELVRSRVSFKGPAHPVKAYFTRPVGDAKLPALILIHEIWGLDAHIEGVADRFAAEGYAVLAPDLMGSDPQLADTFTPSSIQAVKNIMRTMQPGRMRDPAYQQAEMAKLPEGERAVIGRFWATALGGNLPFAKFTEDLASAHAHLSSEPSVDPSRVGSLGFCFGGTMSARLACTGRTQACVVFYGHNPDPIDMVEKMACPFLGNYGGEDAGLNVTLEKLVAAMVKYKKDFAMRIYPGAPHAFFNDTAPSYREAAASEAWKSSLAFLDRCLRKG